MTSTTQTAAVSLTANVVGDCNSNGVADVSEFSWSQRDDDADGVCNGFDNCPTEANASQDASVCAMQAITVPEDASDPSVPHPTYPGASITLKGIARYGGDQYMWAFGDGSATQWSAITDPYNLGTHHVYAGPVGRLFVATLSVRNSANPATVATAAYRVEIFDTSANLPTDPAQLDVRARMAVDEGLWYLHVHEDRGRYSDGAPGYSQGWATWQGSSANIFVGRDCEAVDALERSGNLPQGSWATDPYVEDVQRGLNRILANSAPMQLGLRPDGNPDADGNGLGVMLGGQVVSGAGWGTTQASSCLLALADSRASGRTAAAGLPNVYGRTYAAIGQDAVDWLAWDQMSSSSFVPGSWPIQPGQNPDLDTLLWPVLALQASERELGVTTATFVRPLLSGWLLRNQYTSSGPLNGAWPVFTNWYLPSMTAAGIIAEQFVGQAITSPAVESGLGFLYRDWGDQGLSTTGNCWTANVGQGEEMQAVTEALVSAQLSHLTDYDYFAGVQGAASFDWYHTLAGQTQVGYASYLVSNQFQDGSWTDTIGCYPDSGVIATATAVKILTRDGPPVADAGGPYNTDLNKPVAFDGSHSYAPAGGALTYAWDFDYDGSNFNVDATGVRATDQAGFPTYSAGANGTPNGTVHAVALRVTDSTGRQAITVVNVTVKPPPHPPVIVLAPVSASAGSPVQLDASQSYDVDNDPITYKWDLHGNIFAFSDATGATPTWTFATAGTYAVCVQATDHPELNPTPYSAPDWATSACEFVTVSNGPPSPSANAGGPYTGAPGSTIALDGTQSSSPDGLSLSYSWDLDANGVYGDSTSSKPSFTIPGSASVGTKYDVCLKVSAAGATSSPSCSTVTVVTAMQPPVCALVEPAVVVSNTGAAQVVTLDGSRSSDPAGASLTYAWTANGGTFDNPTASVTHLTLGPTPGDYTVSFHLRVTNSTLSATCDGTITVVVNTQPTFTTSPTDVTFEIDPNTHANVLTWLAVPTAVQPAQPSPSVTVSNDFQMPLVWIPGTSTRVTWTATDVYGNTSSKSAVLRVVDTTPPVLSLPADFTSPSAVVTYDASATDFVSANVPVTCDHASGSTFPAGTTTVNCSATDGASNTASGQFHVTVTDATPPQITPTISGTQGNNGWYTSDVHVTWTVTDPESAISSRSGCGDATITTDTGAAGITLTCTATSAGGTASVPVTIKRDATPPVVSAGGPYTVAEGSSITLHGSAADADGDPVSLSWDLGAGTFTPAAADSTFSAASIDGPAARNVRLQACDDHGECAIAATTVGITNAPPTGVLPTSVVANESAPVTVTFTNQTDPSTADLSAGLRYAYDCNGASLAGATYATAQTSASMTCTYPSGPATPTLRARIIDKDGGFTEYTVPVTVQNVPPVVSFTGGDTTINEGSDPSVVHTYTYQATDAGHDALHFVSFDCGAGLKVSGDVFDPATGNGSFKCTFPASFLADGTTTSSTNVSATIGDQDGAKGTGGLAVRVVNVAPTVTIASPLNGATYAANTTITFSASFTDPGKLDQPHTCSIDWGDGTTTPAGTVTETAGAGTGRCTATHVFRVGGGHPYKITASIKDKDGDAGSKYATINVIG